MVGGMMDKYPSYLSAKFVELDFTPLKGSLCALYDERIKALTQLLNKKAKDELESIEKHIRQCSAELQQDASTIEILSNLKSLFTREMENYRKLQSSIAPLSAKYELLKVMDAVVSDEEMQLLDSIPTHIRNYRRILEHSKVNIEKANTRHKERLKGLADDVGKSIDSFKIAFRENCPTSKDIPPEEALQIIKSFHDQLHNLRNNQGEVSKGLAVFELAPVTSVELDTVEKDIKVLESVWLLCSEWNESMRRANATLWKDIDADSLEENARVVLSRVKKFKSRAKSWGIYEYLSILLEDFRKTMPLIVALKQPYLKPRHMSQLSETLGSPIDSNMTLKQILALNLHEFHDRVMQITSAAASEADIENKVNEIIETWRNTEISFKPHKTKGFYIIIQTDDLFQLLEDCLLSLSQLKSSDFIATFEDRVESLEKELSLLVGNLELVLTVQREWVYLESIFVGSEDIRRQLPKETSEFESVNGQWKSTIARWISRKNVLNCIGNETTKKRFTSLNETLESIQHSLDQYLETKRMAFPRFYFLSNDELLGILGQARNPFAVQPHISKCFGGMKNIIIIEDSNAGNTLESIQHSLDQYLETKRMAFPRFYFLSNDELLGILGQARNPFAVQPHISKCFGGMKNIIIIEDSNAGNVSGANKTRVRVHGIVSPQGEKVELSTPVLCSSQVEIWLGELESQMRITLKDLFGKCLVDLNRSTSRHASAPKIRGKWLSDHAGQLTIGCVQIDWVSAVTTALSSANPKKALIYARKKQLQTLSRLTDLARSGLNSLDRARITAVITLSVHNRDVMEKLLRVGATSATDFAWLSQLRHYWKDDTCIVQQTNSTLQYDYEYLGASFRLVITPLTDRCYMTLTTALHLKRGGSPQGPAGTGKTETVKDLAKALGRFDLVTNCNSSMDYQTVGLLFSGLCQVGGFGVFDEFNRIEIEVLSVVAQQIQCILDALCENADEFMFEGKMIKLRSCVGIFITMNPGYAGRTELPDNLKALFRPVSMMKADLSIIAEVMLFSQGFKQGKMLAKKLTTLYNLSSLQLSKQPHYDFGMRALKGCATAMGHEKLIAPDKSEDLILYKALRDANIPKLIAEDSPLFNALMSDLFLGIEPPTIDYGHFAEAIHEEMIERGLIDIPYLKEKVIQVYETKCVRHGVMVIGDSGGGKTTAIQLLKAVKERVWRKRQMMLRSKNKEDIVAAAPDNFGIGHDFVPVKEYLLNPKSVPLGGLFGEIDLNTREWTDGIVSSALRTASNDASNTEKWLVFDGPVDTLWIESMNTCLDDTRCLTILNGERISFPPQVSFVFETLDLQEASPATVSRCGMIHMDVQSIGWKNVVQAWINKKLKSGNKMEAELLEELTEKYIPDALSLKYNGSGGGGGGMEEDAFDMLENTASNSSSEPNELVEVPLINAVQSTLRIYDACAYALDGGVKKAKKPLPGIPEIVSEAGEKEEEESGEKEIQQELIEMWFAFAVVWGIGGSFSHHIRAALDILIRDIDGRIPSRDSVYEYVVDPTSRSWVSWESKIPQSWRPAPGTPWHRVLVPTVDTQRNSFLVNHLFDDEKHALLVGEPCGKSLLVTENLTPTLESNHSSIINCAFSAQTSAQRTQSIIENNMEKRAKGVLCPPSSNNVLLFVDDLNMPSPDEYGSQPPLELLRQMITQGGWYDLKKQTFTEVRQCIVLGAMGKPGGGRNDISPRLLSCFNVIGCLFPEKSQIKRIFGTLCGLKFTEFADPVRQTLDTVILASMNVYNTVCTKLLPTPEKSHYIFNLRDLARVFLGLVRADPVLCDSKEGLIRLWTHECFRIFNDRLINFKDKKWFYDMMENVLGSNFSLTLSSMRYQESETLVLYSDFMDAAGTTGGISGIEAESEADHPPYQELPPMPKVKEFFTESMDSYRVVQPNAKEMVLFNDCIEHICRVCRVMRNPSGHCLLCGVGGSGRRSVARYGAFLSGLEVFEITVGRNYRSIEFHEDIKKLFWQCGIENKPTAFLVSDSQFVDESFLEDINSLLTSGTVPNIYSQDDMIMIKEAIKEPAKKHGITHSDKLFKFYEHRVKDNVHVCLCMSPVGEAFRRRLRMFPAVVNCTTIDWYGAWPESALKEVSWTFTSAMELIPPLEEEIEEEEEESEGDGEGSEQSQSDEPAPVREIPSKNDKITASSKLVARKAEEEAHEKLVKHTRESVALAFMQMHTDVEQMNARMASEVGRKNHTTPTSFLGLVSTFKQLFHDKKEEITQKINKLQAGLSRLLSSRKTVEKLQVELGTKKELVTKAQKDCEEAIGIMSVKKAEAAKKKSEVQAKSREVGKESRVLEEKERKAREELDEALPALEEANSLVKELDEPQNKRYIDEVRALKVPHEFVKLVISAVMTLLEEDPQFSEARKVLQGAVGEKAKAKMDPRAPTGFISRLINFKKDRVTDSTFRAVEKYVSNPNFRPEFIERISKAATTLCKWVRAIFTYTMQFRKVEPKRRALEEAQEKLKVKKALLAELEREYHELELELEQLEATLATKTREKEYLKKQVAETELKLSRAKKLVDGLAGERVRWTESIELYKEQLSVIVGDVVVCSGFVAYCGAFASNYRNKLKHKWIKMLKVLKLPHSQKLNFAQFLVPMTSIRQWRLDGLPSDAFSAENGVLVNKGSRFPLMIDPQLQANKWIKRTYKDKKLVVVDPKNKDRIRLIEGAVQFGTPVLLEDIGEDLDPALDSLISQAFSIEGGRKMILIGDNKVQYNENFRLFMTTRLPNPHYSPETCTKVTLVNFAVVQDGLQAQLLATVVRHEKPRLEQQKDKLVVSMARMRKRAEDTEDEILYLLRSSSPSKLLEDETLIGALDTSKKTSEEIARQLAISIQTEAKIDKARKGYEPCAHLASLFFFVLIDLGGIDSMYQFSLDSYTKLFESSIMSSPRSEKLQDRINALNSYHTQAMYRWTCRGLFKRHKLLFSLQMCIKMQQSEGLIENDVYDYFLRGGIVLHKEEQPPNPAEWLSSTCWDNITELDKVKGFENLVPHFEQHLQEWHEWYTTQEPESVRLPGEWEGRCDELRKMCIIRALRSDRIIQAITMYVGNKIGSFFVNPPPFDLKEILGDSNPTTPLIFVLSPGVDPGTMLQQFAQTRGMGDRLSSVALGQGQGPKAIAAIERGIKEGRWVFLLNLHLAISWLPELEKIIETISAGTPPHDDFRLWLSSDPHPKFPIGILQRSLKMTTEPPRGIRSNMMRMFNRLTEAELQSCADDPGKDKAFRRLLFGLTFFHSVILERRKFQYLGWNVSYDFNDADFDICKNLLDLYINTYEEIPWE
ncbi:Dynein axonemal heavy chain 2, partial [Aduncisulcus paluster]